MKIREIEKQDFGYIFYPILLLNRRFSMDHFSTCKIGGVDHVLCDPI